MVKIEINCFLEEKVRGAYNRFCYMQKNLQTLGKEEDLWFIELPLPVHIFTDLMFIRFRHNTKCTILII